MAVIIKLVPSSSPFEIVSTLYRAGCDVDGPRFGCVLPSTPCRNRFNGSRNAMVIKIDVSFSALDGCVLCAFLTFVGG